MHTVESALAAVLRECRRLPAEVISLEVATGRTLDEAVHADLDMPPFDKALVDGYAVRSDDLSGADPEVLEVVDEVDAGGTPRGPLGANQAALVMTGAPLPPGADAVVMLEEVEREAGQVRVRGPVRPGSNRLERGREYRAGDELLPPGSVLNAPRMGVLAATGHLRVRVVQTPTVVVVATGDELVGPELSPGPGQIRDSNSVTLASLVRGLGHEVANVERLPDREEVLRERFHVVVGDTNAGRGFADVLLVSGGVSAGRRDLVPGALEAVGVRPVFHKVKVKPGKPLWFGVGPEREGRPPVLVFGLPGNPVSGIVSVLLFVAPALAVMAGRTAGPAQVERGRLSASFSHRGPRATYHPARRLAGDPARLALLSWAGSADLRAVALSDGFAVFPERDCDYAEGSEIEFLPLPSTARSHGT